MAVGNEHLNYRSFNDLNYTIVKNLHKIPSDIDLIVGVPRSGLMAANLLALHLHLPLTDVQGYLEGKILPSGWRVGDSSIKFSSKKKVLVLDDSLATGRAMEEVREKLSNSCKEKSIQYGVVYMNPEAKDQVDLFLEKCSMPRIFEWNMMNHRIINKSCVDIDGVLCKDPTPEENDDGENYLKFLKNAKPLLRANYRIHALVTNRLEKYRPETEEWLARQGISYDELIMRDFKTQEERRAANNYGLFKGKVFSAKSGARLFIESSISQAKVIAKTAGKPVYCVDQRKMLWPSDVSVAKRKARSLKSRISNKFRQIIEMPQVYL